MRLEKLDAPLQAALDSGGSHVLFLHTDEALDDAARATLAAAQASEVAPSGLYVAHLSREQIERLSEQTWVKRLRLAQALRPL